MTNDVYPKVIGLTIAVNGDTVVDRNTPYLSPNVPYVRYDVVEKNIMRPWHYSATQLPNVWIGRFLVTTDAGKVQVWEFYDGRWKDENGLFVANNPLAWQELPEPLTPRKDAE